MIHVTADLWVVWYSICMAELLERFFEMDGEQLRQFYMYEIMVDGIYSSYINPEGSIRRMVTAPMFHRKGDRDPTPQMVWRANKEVDEETWLREGRVIFKTSS